MSEVNLIHGKALLQTALDLEKEGRGPIIITDFPKDGARLTISELKKIIEDSTNE